MRTPGAHMRKRPDCIGLMLLGFVLPDTRLGMPTQVNIPQRVYMVLPQTFINKFPVKCV